jgi:hypothetical protein
MITSLFSLFAALQVAGAASSPAVGPTAAASPDRIAEGLSTHGEGQPFLVDGITHRPFAGGTIVKGYSASRIRRPHPATAVVGDAR